MFLRNFFLFSLAAFLMTLGVWLIADTFGFAKVLPPIDLAQLNLSRLYSSLGLNGDVGGSTAKVQSPDVQTENATHDKATHDKEQAAPSQKPLVELAEKPKSKAIFQAPPHSGGGNWGCDFQSRDPIVVSIDLNAARALISKKTTFLLEAEKRLSCLTQGAKIHVVTQLPDQKLFRSVAVASVNAVEKTNSKDFLKSFSKLDGLPPAAEFLELSKKRLGPEFNEPLVFAKLNLVEEYTGAWHLRHHAPFYPGVTIVGLVEVASAIEKMRSYDNSKKVNEIPVIIDVRPHVAFEYGTIPRSINIPFIVKKELLGKVGVTTSPSLAIEDSAVNWNSVQKYRDRPVIVFGPGPHDSGSLWMIEKLIQMKFTDVSWYWGGYSDFLGKSFLTPKHSPFGRIIDAPEAQKMVQSGAAELIDVRQPDGFKRQHIAGSKNVTFAEKKRWIYSGDDADKILASIPDYKTWAKGLSQKPVILTGLDLGDWKPFWAAAGIANKEKVFILRGGFAEWLYYSEQQPNVYRVVTTIPPTAVPPADSTAGRNSKTKSIK